MGTVGPMSTSHYATISRLRLALGEYSRALSTVLARPGDDPALVALRAALDDVRTCCTSRATLPARAAACVASVSAAATCGFLGAAEAACADAALARIEVAILREAVQ